MSKLYNFFGTTVKNGKLSIRGAVEIKYRLHTLTKDGHTDLIFIELPVPMNKLHATKFISQLPEFQTWDQQHSFEIYIKNHDDGTEIVFE